MKKLDQDYIWQCDYGDRNKLIEDLKKLLIEQDATSLQMIAVFVNNIPYILEFFICVSYKNPKENHINTMFDLFKNKGLIYRSDLTLKMLFSEMGTGRRFNVTNFINEQDVELRFKNLFYFPEKLELMREGYVLTPIGKPKTIFISHSSTNKQDIEALIPYLNSQNLPIWYDKVNIDYGDNITNKIQEGIDNSEAVIFWITNEFLESKWCKTEMSAFITKNIENETLIISILDSNIKRENLPMFLRNIKYITFSNPINFEYIANEIKNPLKKKLNII